MALKQSDVRIGLRRALGTSRPPERITQQAFNSSDLHLNHLVRLADEEKPDSNDLWKYLEDIRHCEIQSDLLGHLLPLLLEIWRDDLHGAYGYGGMIEHFYPLLANTSIFASHVKPQQVAAVSDFMRRSVLEEIDDQRDLNFK